MYKFIASLLIITISFFVITCARSNKNSEVSGNIIEIRERVFATQINSIYLNTRDYLGRTIKLEGIFKTGQVDEDNLYYVLRYSLDDCCGLGTSGFEVRWAQTEPETAFYPAEDSWVEVTGVLKQYESGFNKFLYLELSSLIVLDRRGAEYVIR